MKHTETALPAQSIFNNLAATIERLNDIRDKKSGTLRVAAPQLMACTQMPRLISQWLAEYPGITVKLHDTLPERLLSVLRNGEVALANGMGLTTCPSSSEALVHAHGLIMIPLVKPVYYRQIYIYYMAGKSLSPAANSFIKSIQARVSPNASKPPTEY